MIKYRRLGAGALGLALGCAVPANAQFTGKLPPHSYFGNPQPTDSPAAAVPFASTFVANNAALTGTIATTIPVVRLSVNNPGDAPPVLFWPHPAGNCASQGFATDRGHCVDGPAATSWVNPDTSIDARQFGADASGLLDSTAAIQAWGNWAVVAEGRLGWLAAGLYKTTTSLVWTGGKNMALRGAGKGVSKILYSGASANLDIVTASTFNQVQWHDFEVESATDMTGGAGIHLIDVNYSDLGGVTTGQGGKLGTGGGDHPIPKLYNGFVFEHTGWNSLIGASPYVKNDALLVYRGVELTVDNFINVNKGGTGIHLAGGFGGLYLKHVSVECIGVGARGLLVDNAFMDATNLQVFVSHEAVFDSCTTAGAEFADTKTSDNGTKSLTWNGWAGGTGPGNPGLYINQWNNGTVRLGGMTQLINNQGSGLKINDTTAMVAIDPAATIMGNGGWGVECTTPMENIISDAQVQHGTWSNLLGEYQPSCGGQLARFYWPTFTPVVTCNGTGTPPTLSSATGSFYRYGRKSHIHYDFQLSSTGTCTTGLRLSSPASVILQSTCAFHGRENLSAIAVQGYWEGPPLNYVVIQKYDGNVTQTNGARFIIEGECQTLG